MTNQEEMSYMISENNKESLKENKFIGIIIAVILGSLVSAIILGLAAIIKLILT